LEEYYRNHNFSIKKINADQYVENVFDDILGELGPCFKVYEM